MAACKKPTPVPLDLQPLIESFTRYEETIGRATATQDGHRVNLRNWQKYLAGQGISNLADVTPQIVTGFQAWVYNYRTRFKRPFTIASQIQILNSVQVFYQYLEKTGKVLSNPAEVIHLPKAPRRLPAVILSSKEMKRLLSQPDTSTVLGFRDRTMYEVLYSTGIRIGELIRLRVQDITLSEGTIFIHAGKGQKDRVVPVGATACRYLKEYIEQIRPKFREAATTDYVFFNKMGRLPGKSGIGNKLHLYAMRAGIEKRITVHTFRHTLATEMLKGGADLRQIQELLGHGNLRTTQLYTHIVKGELKRVQAECHPREQTELPEGFVAYRGRNYLTDDDRREVAHVRKNPSTSLPASSGNYAEARRAGREPDET
jgi:integrase/recombinase XerD